MEMIVRVARKFFSRHPMLSNAVVYGGLYVGAELTQQIVTRKVMVDEPEDLDFASMGRYLVIGAGFNAHYLYLWYKWLDPKFVGTGMGVIVRKLLLDQIVMSPPLYVVFYVGMSVMEGRDDVFEECRRKYFKTLLTSYCFWVPMQVINFLYLPTSIRVMYLGACSYVWTNILCWLKRGNE